MASRSKFTIVLITADSLARVDLRAGKSIELLRSSRMDRPKNGDMAHAVSAALDLEAQRCGKIWVLSDDFWSGRVSLSKEITDAIADDELEQTLAFEAEYDSAFSPFESRICYTAVADPQSNTSSWWVTQAELSQIKEIEAAVAGRAGKLAGLASMAVTVPGLEDSQAALHASLERSARAGSGASNQVLVADHAELERHAQVWLETYLAAPAQIPTIRSLPHAMSGAQQWKLGLFLAAGVFAVCLTLHVRGEYQFAQATAQAMQLADQKKQLRLELHETNLRAQHLASLEQQQQADRAAHAEHVLRQQHQKNLNVFLRKRPADLLHALATTARPQHWIRNIELNAQGAVLSGLAIDALSVTELTQSLERELNPKGWIIQPAKMSVVDDGPLVQFQVVLTSMDRYEGQLAAAIQGGSDAG